MRLREKKNITYYEVQKHGNKKMLAWLVNIQQRKILKKG